MKFTTKLGLIKLNFTDSYQKILIYLHDYILIMVVLKI